MKISAEKKVGVVVFIGIGLLILFTVLFTDIRWFRRYYTIDVWFDNVGGLTRGDKVTLGGMEIGDVQELVLIEGSIRVRLAIRNDHKIPRAVTFKVVDVGLLGGKRVDITWGEGPDGFIQSGDEIHGLSQLGFSEAISSLGDSGKKVEDILKSVQEVTSRISAGEGTIGRLVVEEDIYQDAKKLFADLRTIIDENLSGIREIVDELKQSAPELKETLANLRSVTDRIARGEGTIGRLVQEDQIYEEGVSTLVSVKTASEKLSALAERAERLQVFIGAETALNIKTDRLLSKAFLHLEPTPQKVYMVGMSLLSGPETEAQVTDQPDVDLDAQIGLRFFRERLTVRAGLLEGRLGGGIDWRIWDRKLVATVEGRDVWTKEKDEGIKPFLLRGRVTADLVWGFYVHVGVDNLLDEPAFNFGAGLRIRDDDIRALFGLISLTQ